MAKLTVRRHAVPRGNVQVSMTQEQTGFEDRAKQSEGGVQGLEKFGAWLAHARNQRNAPRRHTMASTCGCISSRSGVIGLSQTQTRESHRLRT